MWRGKKRFGGGGEPAAKRQAAGDEGPSESAEDGTVVAEVRVPYSVPSQSLLQWRNPNSADPFLGGFSQISKNKKVSVRSFKGKTYVDIREFYVKDGKTLPTRKGTPLLPHFIAVSRAVPSPCVLHD